MVKYIILCFLLSMTTMDAKNTKLTLLPESELWFDGTSTLHNFKCESDEIVADLTLIDSLNVLSDSSNFILSVTVPTTSLDCDDMIMNRNMYEALKSDAVPEITYLLQSIDSESLGGGKYKLNSVGQLKIAGVVQTIHLIVDAFENDNGIIEMTGHTLVDMTEYNIEPPSFWFGTIKTGNVIDISFDLKFKKEWRG